MGFYGTPRLYSGAKFVTHFSDMMVRCITVKGLNPGESMLWFEWLSSVVLRRTCCWCWLTFRQPWAEVIITDDGFCSALSKCQLTPTTVLLRTTTTNPDNHSNHNMVRCGEINSLLVLYSFYLTKTALAKRRNTPTPSTPPPAPTPTDHFGIK